MTKEKTLALQTRAVHAGELERRPGAPMTVPVYHSAMFVTARSWPTSREERPAW